MIRAMSGWSTMALPTVAPLPMTTCSYSAGRPHSSISSSARRDRAERRLAGRLEHHRAAGGDRRRQLVGHEVEREVERGDRPDHADRHAQREAELALAGRRCASSGTISPASVRASAAANWNVPTARSASTPCGLDRLGRLPGDDRGELLAALGEPHRGAVEDLGPLPRRQRAGRAAPRPRRSTARSTSAGVARRHLADQRAVVGRARDGRSTVAVSGRGVGPVEPAAWEPSCERRYCRRCRPRRRPSTRSSTGPGRSPSPIAAAPATRPENTMPAFQDAIDLGYRYLETDVHVTADGVLVAFHDDDLHAHVRTPGQDQRAAVERGAHGAWSTARRRSRRWRSCSARSPTARVNIDCKADDAVDAARRRGRSAPTSIDRVCLGVVLRPRACKQLRAALGPTAVHRARPGGARRCCASA